MSRRAVFLDRDGTLIEERHYLSRPDQLRLLPGAAAALRRLSDLGLALVLVTNQSGVARGIFTEAELAAVHAGLVDLLAAEGAALDGLYYCPHHPEDGVGELTRNCDCRKPGTAMVEAACADLDLEPEGSWMIGDKAADIELARAAGLKGILVRSGHGRASEAAGAGAGAHATVDDLAAAAALIRDSEIAP